MRSHALLSLLIAAAIAATPRCALAAWPHSPGTNLPLCTAAGDQYPSATIASDGAGGAIVTWFDYRTGNADVYAQHVLASGAVDPAWPANGRALCTAVDQQQGPTIVSDGAGGAIVAWDDFRSGINYDIYAQHVLASGAVDGAWPANGRVLCTAPNAQQYQNIVSDGAGGAIVTWEDYRGGAADVYAQHVLASGAVDGAWPANGRALCTAANGQQYPTIVSDGAGGAIVTWHDYRGGATADTYAQHVLAGGAVDGAWPANGRALCTAANDQQFPMIVSDGAGGAIVTWFDYRVGATADIYAQHVLAGGAVDGAWPPDGRALCTAANNQLYATIVSDGSGGAVVTWEDSRVGTNDVYAQHVLSSGAVDGAWPVDGRALCTAANSQEFPAIVSDGAGGAIVSWQDYRGGATADIYAQRVLASGAVDGAWPANGRALCTAANDQLSTSIVSDGVGGAIVTWFDYRSGPTSDVYAQRVAPSGYLGSPEPRLVSVRDVPNDQGGAVKVSWQASWLDTESPYVVDHYWIFRSAPPNAALTAIRLGARLLGPGDPPPVAGERAYLALAQGTTYYWEYVASTPAAHFTSTYSYVASTTSDSVAASNPRTDFIVVAYDAANTVFFPSNADSGYSVDNLPPSAPAPFTGQYNGGNTALHWNPNGEPDLAGYRVYRGISGSFVPGPGNLVASPADTGYTDPAGAPYYYKLSAVDIHGNESGFALLLPAGALDSPRTDLPAELAIEAPSPNPARVALTLHYALPREGRVSLGIYDLAGRRVRLLVAGIRPAGEQAATWDLRDEAGHAVGAGLYFVRLEAAGRSLSERFATLR